MSFSTVMASLGKRRMVTMGPLRATGGMTTLTREPSSRWVSTMGSLSFTARPAWETNLVMTVSSSWRLSKWFSSRLSRPARSTKMWSKPLIITSVTSGSPMICPRTPSPRMASKTAAVMNDFSLKFMEDTAACSSPPRVRFSSRTRAIRRRSSSSLMTVRSGFWWTSDFKRAIKSFRAWSVMASSLCQA